MRFRVVQSSRGYPYLVVTDLSKALAKAETSAKERLPYVVDTWLARTEAARVRNLLMGYVAQEILAGVFRREGIPFISYDDTRIDASKNADPFDFILLPPGFGPRAAMVRHLQGSTYPLINSQGRFRRDDRVAFRDYVHGQGGLICDLKSSVDNNSHGIEAIVHSQHHIAYAEQKNDAGFVVVSGRDYLRERGQTFEEYAARKQALKDVHFRVFFADSSLTTGYYVGYIPGRELVEEGEVGPFPGTPWVLYHRTIVADGFPPGTEREVLFG